MPISDRTATGRPGQAAEKGADRAPHHDRGVDHTPHGEPSPAPPLPAFRGAPLTPGEIAAIAEHEHLTIEEAMERGAALLEEPHGDAALRQIVWDTLVRARQMHETGRIAALTELYEETCRRRHNPCDRRLAPTRDTHPFIPPAVH